MSVKLQSSSGGSVEIAAPVTASDYVLTVPAATDTLVGVASAQTLTNKTLTSPTIDMGVKLQSSSGGIVEIAAPVTASNYTLTAPAANGTILNDASSLAAANLTGDIASARITSALNASGSAPIYACRAWVNFNGTGTVAIRASGNVSSITDLGVGYYQVNITTAMPDTNYCVTPMFGTRGNSIPSNYMRVNLHETDPITSSHVRISTCTDGVGSVDNSYVGVAVFR